MSWFERRRSQGKRAIASAIASGIEDQAATYRSRLVSHPQIFQTLAELKTFPAGSTYPLSKQVMQWERLVVELANAEPLIARSHFRLDWTGAAYGSAGRLVAAGSGRENDKDGAGNQAVQDSTKRLVEDLGEGYAPFFLHSPGEAIAGVIVEGFYRIND